MYNKSLIFSVAWTLFKNPETRWTFSFCLSQAWAAMKLKNRMRIENTDFAFVKDNGDFRLATGRINSEKGTGKAHDLKVVYYFDIVENGMRCFRVDRLA